MNDQHLSRRTLLTATAVATAAVTAGATPALARTPQQRAISDRPLKQIIDRMTLEEKVGQLFSTYVFGSSATDPAERDVNDNLSLLGVRSAAELVAKYHLGGIIYFGWSRNIVSPRQLGEMSNAIQTVATAQRSPVPVLLSIDQEQGSIVQRLGPPATQFPGAMAMGAGGSRRDARTAGRISGLELAATGVYQNYAPVADVNINPANPVIGIRSFGSDPNTAAALVAAQLTGYQSAGVSSCVKHFPGHGDTGTDSHSDLPLITHTREEWNRLDAPPFRAAIAAGVDSIMTAHIQIPALDPSNDPATLSRPIITGILREQLGFDGLIVTDALNMRGVRVKYGDERIPVLALKAGVDQLLFPQNLAVAWNAVRDAVRNGELTEARLDESILRLLRIKQKVGLLKDPLIDVGRIDRVVGNRRHLALAEEITEKTTTLLVNRNNTLPLHRRRQKNVLVVGANPPRPNDTESWTTEVIASTLNGLGFTATELPTPRGEAPTAALIDQAVAAASGKDAIVVATQNVSATSTQRTLVARLVATGVPVVALHIGNPYDIARLDGVAAALASYGWTGNEVRSATRVIAGRVEPEGRLPVPIQRADDPSRVLFPVGHGLEYDD
ncbi:glycoside hydrolase family 3 protein [Streptomyces sp. NPDC004609]|uniref:glycoside hydrolase family 3 protein n=1 Tax=Streptomyces sp. NPDC004609 TaxID=3364704 RepID=UPI0036CF1FBA